MVSPKYLFNLLKVNGVGFFSGVPDSLLKYFCAYITDNADEKEHIIAANEGGAIGLCAGYHLATGGLPLAYMQNSGIGNAVNPLLSLTDEDVYSIPVLLVIGWRGEPGVKDEPQHVKQGKVTLSLLELMGIPYLILSDNENDVSEQINVAFTHLKNKATPFALIVRRDTFEKYQLKKIETSEFKLTREVAISTIVDHLNCDDIIVSTTGMASRELYEYRETHRQGHCQDFLTVGSMGHASQIALGIAISKPERRVFCFDGDGAVLMHLGSLAICGSVSLSNFIHIIFNNGAHDSVGGQPTVGFGVDFVQIAKACGYIKIHSVTSVYELINVLSENCNTPTLIEVKVQKGSRKDLGRPKCTPKDNKKIFMNFLE